jgi:hypothetical protein
MSWNELTRRQQRILIKLFGGGSLRCDDSVEAADLIQRGLVTRNGLTRPGSKFSRQRSNHSTKPDGRGITFITHFHAPKLRSIYGC